MSVTTSETVARDTPTTAAVDTASRVDKKAAKAETPRFASVILLREWLAERLQKGEISEEEGVRLMKLFDDAEIREMEKQRSLVSRGHKYAKRIWQLLTFRWSKSQESEIQ